MIVSPGGRNTAAHLAAGVLLALAGVSARAADDHGDDAGSATPITVGVSVSGDIETGTDDDYFSFSATAGVPYTLETTSGTLSDTVLYLYDTDGTTQLDFDDDGGVGWASLINWTCPASGTYYARVGSWGSDTGTYSLLVAIPARILTFVGYADTGAFGEYQNSLTAISTYFTNYIESSTVTEDPAVLATELAGKNVFLIPEQETAGAGVLASLGTSWAATLTTFVNNGGTVIVCSYSGEENLILNNSGLMTLTKTGTAGSVPLVEVVPHLLTEGVTSPFTNPFISTYSTVTDGTVVVETEVGATPIVVTKDVGAGHAVMIGADFFTLGTDFDRIIANAVQWRDDIYEPNDTLATAWDFSFGEIQWLSSYGGSLGVQWDDDWYMITVTAGFENVVIDCAFTHADGDIDIDLVDSAGVVVASSTSVTDDESIDTSVAGPGTYYIRVHYGDAGNTYDLWWDDLWSDVDLYDDGTAWAGFSPTTVSNGLSFSAYCDVRNGGTTAAGGFWVDFYASTDTVIDTSDYLLGYAWVPGVAAGDYVNADLPAITWPPLDNPPIGTYYVGWIIDSLGDVPETDESNNTEYKPSPMLTVSAPPDDIYEENDTPATAWDFSLGAMEWLSTYGGELGVQLDDDWYMIDVLLGYENVVIDCTFTHADGDIDIRLVDSGGVVVVASSTSTTDNESIDFVVAGPGTYYIRVSFADAGNSYDLWWDNVAVPGGADDSYEPNNTLLTAWDFSGGAGAWLSSIGGLGVQWNSDWYMINVAQGYEDVLIDCTFIDAAGDIDIELVDSASVLLASAVSTTDNEQISMIVAGPGTYYIRVYWDNMGNTYDLMWNTSMNDDSYEENDTLATAWDFSLGETQWLSTYGGEMGVQLDDDWYMIDVTAGFENVVIDCTFTHTDGDINIDLVDSGGVVVDSSILTNDNESIDFVVAGPGTYYIVVYGANAGNPYDLWWGAVSVPVSDDPYEPNNSMLSAWDFSLGETQWLSTFGGALGIQWNDDWYMIDVTAGYENVVIDCTFTHSDGDIDIELVDSAGAVVAGSWSTSDDENIDFTVAGPGTYYIVVYWGDAGNTYDLWWDDVFVPPMSSEDPYESNNTLLTAWDFSLGEGTLLGTYGGALGVQWNADWYMIDVTAGDENVVIDATFTDADGDIDIELVDSTGVVVAGSYSTTDDENIAFMVAGPGTYYIRVFYGNAGNTYDLWWDDVEATPPSVSITDPIDGATGVATGSTVQVTFSEAMDQTATETAFSTSPAVTGSFSWSGDVLTFTPSAALAEQTVYTVTIGTNATDLAGNPLAAAYIFSFTTGEFTSPSVVSTSPAAGDTGVLTSTTVQVTFSEAMDQAVTEAASGIEPSVPFSLSWNVPGDTLTFTFNPALAEQTTYTVIIIGDIGSSIGASATDLAGTPLAADYRSSFTTISTADESSSACGCSPQQTDTSTLGNVFGAILSWLPLMLLLLFRNRHSQRRATE